jgi:hypothetical protein
MTSLVVQTANKKKNSLEKHVASLLHFASYLTFHRQLGKPLFNASTPSTIHSSVQILFSITHKQTRLPTHAFFTVATE